VPGSPNSFPVWQWGKNYSRRDLRGISWPGLHWRPYLVPSAIGDASLAGLPPQAGLYAALFPGLVFWLFCSSSKTAISATSGLSLLLGASLSGLAQGDPARYVSMAAWTALLTASIAFAAWLVKAGAIVDFVSESVMTGFKAGVALYLASSQVPKLCGFTTNATAILGTGQLVMAHLDEVNLAALAMGGGRWQSWWWATGFGAISLSLWWWLSADSHSARSRGGEQRIKVLGPVPQGLPMLRLPALEGVQELNNLLPLVSPVSAFGG